MIAPVPLGPLLRAFFADHLVQQRTVSPQTVNAYRDAFRLLLTFLDQHHQRKPDALTLDDLDAPVILAFLDHLEENRGNSVQSPQCASDRRPLLRPLRGVTNAGVARPDIPRPRDSPQARATRTGPLPDAAGNGRHPDRL